MKYTSLIINMFFSLALTSYGQSVEVKIAVDASFPTSNWDAQKLAEVKITLETFLEEYSRGGSLLDEHEKKVSSNSIDKFHSLFSPSARLTKDFMENIPIERIPLRDYTSSVYNLLPLHGVQFRMESVTLLEIRYDPAGFYTPILEVEKSVYNYVKSSGKVEISSGRFLVQFFHLDILASDMNKVKITDIKGEDIAPPDDYTQIMGIQLGAVMPLVTARQSEFWTLNHDESNLLEPSGRLGGMLGIFYQNNRFVNPRNSTNKRISWGIGLSGSLYLLQTKLSNFRLTHSRTIVVYDGGNYLYKRIPRYVNLKEKILIGTVEIPLGISYRILKKRMMSVHVDARFLPALTVFKHGKTKGEALYSGSFLDNEVDTNIDFLDEDAFNSEDVQSEGGLGPYDVGQKTINENIDFTSNFFSYGVRISPTAYIDLTDYNPNWGIKIGLDFTYFLKSPLQTTEATEEMLLSSTDINNSVLLHYSQKLNFPTVGFNIGLYHKISTEP